MMPGRFTVESVFKTIDRVSAPVTKMANRVGKATRAMGRGVQRLNARFTKLAKSVGPALGLAGVAGALLAVKLALSAVISTGAEFEQTLVGAGARFEEDIRRGTDAFLAMSDAAREVGRTTEFTSNQAAGALNFMAKAGLNADQSLRLLPGFVDLATAAELELARSTDIATDSLGAFGLITKDAAKLQANFARVSDQMSTTVNSTNTDMEQLFETIKKGAPAATAAGVPMETFLALTGRLANAGLKASDAGTALKNIFLKLADTKIQRSLKRLGVAVTNIDTGEMRDFADIMDDLLSATAGKTKIQRAGIINALFGLRGVTGVATILAQGTEGFRKLREEILASEGATARLAKIMRDTLTGRMKELNSAVESLSLSLFAVNAEGIEKFTTNLTEATRAMDEFVKTHPRLVKVGSALSAIGGAVLILSVGVAAIGAAIMFAVESVAGLAVLFFGSAIALGLWVGQLDIVVRKFKELRLIAGVVSDFITRQFKTPAERARDLFRLRFQGRPDIDLSRLPGIFGPEERLARSESSSTQRSEVALTINDRTGRAELDAPVLPPGFQLVFQSTGDL